MGDTSCTRPGRYVRCRAAPGGGRRSGRHAAPASPAGLRGNLGRRPDLAPHQWVPRGGPGRRYQPPVGRGHVSGNGRCTTLLYPPQSRMTDPWLRAVGTSGVGGVVSGTGFGVFARHVGGGEVIEPAGELTFPVTGGCLIENGMISDLIEEGTTVTSTGTQVLRGHRRDGRRRRRRGGRVRPVSFRGCRWSRRGPTLRVRSLLVGSAGR
ncbi:metallopeptidase TldD-related protein [Streptomyces sp. bgisy022]|uniref:metallopeptidase TldD-related protein n=1 Tax=Streptomyces sp. bgisy022 TaxID=3413769 RepID=UPI003D74CC48